MDRSKTRKGGLEELTEDDKVETWKLPDHKDLPGWRGPHDSLRLKGGNAIVRIGADIKELPSELVRPFNPNAFWAGTRGPILLVAMAMVGNTDE